MSTLAVRWAPAMILWAGVALISGVRGQREMELRRPLDETVPREILGMTGTDQEVSPQEARVAGFTDYLVRTYAEPGGTVGQEQLSYGFSIYVGYYDSQTQGKTIHSPKNCLPGSGWEALQSSVTTVPVSADRRETVNRYLLQRDDQQALVLYWYQGRGRVAHNEYLVKWDLLRDAALLGRSDEALVRIVVPMGGDEEEALDRARRVAAELVPAVGRALPAS